MSALGWTEAELDTMAWHIGYELRMLTGQVTALERRNVRSPREQALIEAALVHSRLLDEFLTKPAGRRKFAARAALWGWGGGGFLTRRERGRVNAKVAHLAIDRLTQPDWQPQELGPLAVRCCERILGFVEHVGRTEPARGSAFATAKACAAGFVAAARP